VSSFDGRRYQERFDALAASGVDVHGEANFVLGYSPKTVLDAGCGTGRVARELSRHGIEVLGVDVDSSMIQEARRLGPTIPWIHHDLATLELGQTFDVVLLAGNVPIFCPVADRTALIRTCSNHVQPGGVLVAGFELGRGYELAEFDDTIAASGLVLSERFSTWGRDPFEANSTYAVSVAKAPD